ncbi:MAG: ATP-binding cassette domain-containing protein [Anaerolineae bacterium]
MIEARPLMEVLHLSKNFGAFSAVEDVSLRIYPAEVLGVAGQSGSGKSALCKLLAGLEPPTEGEIYFDGRLLSYPFRRHELGIEVIYQEPELAEHLDIVSNIFLGRELGWSLLLPWLRIPNRRRMEREARRVLDQLEVKYRTLRQRVDNLSAEQRQLLAVARVMIWEARLVIIDEPTFSLSYPYQQKLLSLIQRWQQKGTAVLFTGNNLDHLLAVTDRIVVLRHGRRVAVHHTDEADREEIVAEMVGTTDRQELTPIIWALDSYYHARAQAERLRQQRLLLEQDLEKQDTLNQQLIEELGKQIKALDSANVSLQDAQRRLLTEREQERKRLAREIHDQVIQDLLIVNYQLEDAEACEGITPELQRRLAQVRSDIRALVEDLRHICGNLRPPTIDSLGLGAALQSYTQDWTERTGIAVDLELEDSVGRLPEPIELSIFRIVQEGLSNVRKHASARRVHISLLPISPRTLMLSIADDGQGLAEDFDLSTLSERGHYGLLGISERVALLGGRLKLQNRAEGGVLIQVEIPHPRLK